MTPLELLGKLAAHVTEDFSAFEMDGDTNRFVPVAVIGGVPLCVVRRLRGESGVAGYGLAQPD